MNEELPLRLDPSRCPLVIAGAWNQAIFSPAWLARHVTDGRVPALQIGFGPQGLFSQFLCEDVVLGVVPAQVQIVPTQVTDGALETMERIAVKILTMLPQTPVSAAGINFGFDLDKSEELDHLFEFSDTLALARLAIPVGSSAIVRRIPQADGLVLNMQITKEPSGIKIDMNHHRTASSATDAVDRLAGGLRAARQRSLDMLRDLYGLTLQEP